MVVMFVQLFVLFVHFVFVHDGGLLPFLLETGLAAGFRTDRIGRNELLQIFSPAGGALGGRG